LSRVASPAVRFLTASTDVVLRMLGSQPSTEPSVTEAEVKVLIEQGTQAGVFEETEQDMIEGVLRLGERRIGAVMTPRVHVVWIDTQDPAEEIYRKVIDSHHSRFPVARGSLENAEGTVLAKDLLAQHLKSESLDLRPLLRETLFVPETMPALRVLELFKDKGTHMAVVIGEYGSVEGIVTPYDILEDVVGHVAFAGAPAEPQGVQRADGSWLIDGLLPIDRLKEIFDLTDLPEEESGTYQTVGGFVIHLLGVLPTTGQSLEWNDLRLEVVDMDEHRVDKVLVQRRKASEP
jgi:putative hemolysin